jgi:hypothetical protein
LVNNYLLQILLSNELLRYLCFGWVAWLKLNLELIS